MSSRDELAQVIANDPRYSIEAYALVLEALNQARQLKLKSAPSRSTHDDCCEVIPQRPVSRSGSIRTSRGSRATSTPRELCDAVRKLALRQYGLAGRDGARSLGRPIHVRRRRTSSTT